MSGGGHKQEIVDWGWIKKIPRLWDYDVAHEFTLWLLGWHVEPILVGTAVLFILLGVAVSVDPNSVIAAGAMLIAISPVWLPVYLFVFLWVTWMHYIRYDFWFKQDHVLLEIELPPEVEKSQQAMELILTMLHNSGGETTFIARIINGAYRPIWSLEIASNEGRIGYYIHTRRSWKNLIEARIYGQFPEARVHEVEDYVDRFNLENDEHEWWGCEYQKSVPDALPIRSYIDYGLDKDTDKPETRVDPLTNVLELLGTMGEGEHMWMQIVLRAHKNEEWYGFYLAGNKFIDDANSKIKEIYTAAAKRAKEVAGLGEDEAGRVVAQLTSGEKLQIDAIEHSKTKLFFDGGIRTLYIARKDKFDGVNIGSLVRFFDPFKYPNFNAIGVTRGLAIFDYPWQDWNNIRRNKIKENLFFQYKHRAYFYVPYDQKESYYTTEELATIWHFPNSNVRTPGLQRVPSRVAEAPLNLPI